MAEGDGGFAPGARPLAPAKAPARVQKDASALHERGGRGRVAPSDTDQTRRHTQR